MPVLKPNEYDISYFDGNLTSLSHNAGFSYYTRWPRSEGEHSLGEYWKDLAYKLLVEQDIKNKKVLELACAKGFVVKDLRDMGVNAYGIDVSQYALDNAESESKPYLYCGDIRTALLQFADKEFDLIFSIRLWECIDDSDIVDLITQISRITKRQIHIISAQDGLNTNYYNSKSLQQWLNYGFPEKTILFQYNNLSNHLVK